MYMVVANSMVYTMARKIWKLRFLDGWTQVPIPRRLIPDNASESGLLLTPPEYQKRVVLLVTEGKNLGPSKVCVEGPDENMLSCR